MSQDLEHADQIKQDAAIRRVIGISALRRLRTMVDTDQAQQANKLRQAQRVLVWILIAAALGLGFVLRHLIFA